ncbi:hypothetical protein RlegWSM1455_20240 [Rhizobium laguerreae]|nr:hypothetical protein [Rhizobium laguerreae]MBY3414926.1 hypothetical protein [Rhizobium laguerreae]MBY3487553.1 hypothetical protein [Rhizobium laguerreae]NKM67952.1 hypothetical protein [Rhizobium laguerreae]UFW63821.1 hypothetical protein RlegWSM1455_20240 [Rhizobium laguerreae]
MNSNWSGYRWRPTAAYRAGSVLMKVDVLFSAPATIGFGGAHAFSTIGANAAGAIFFTDFTAA